MPFAHAVGARVRLIDESSEFKGNRISPKSGEVTSRVAGASDPLNEYQVRPDGHGCGQTRLFLEKQLAAETLASSIDYSNC